MLAKSAFPGRQETCAAILAHAHDPSQDATIIGRDTYLSGAVPQPTVVRAVSALQLAKPLHIIIAGAPCSGKGTQCELLKTRYGVVHISTGDLLRVEIANGTDLGAHAKTFMERGELIPDDVIIRIVKEKVQGDECRARGWLLDGFPRTAVQAKALREAGIHADVFLQLNVPHSVVIERVTGRRTDPQTGITYHIQYDPPPQGEVAERCIQRVDDTEEKIKTRLQAYDQAIDAIAEQYADIRIEFDGNQKKQHITGLILAAVDEVVKERDDDNE